MRQGISALSVFHFLISTGLFLMMKVALWMTPDCHCCAKYDFAAFRVAQLWRSAWHISFANPPILYYCRSHYWLRNKEQWVKHTAIFERRAIPAPYKHSVHDVMKPSLTLHCSLYFMVNRARGNYYLLTLLQLPLRGYATQWGLIDTPQLPILRHFSSVLDT